MVRRSEQGHSLPSRSAVVRKIEDAQDDAVRALLREAALSDARAGLALQRIRQIAVSAFIELDDLYRTFAALQQEPRQDYVHQQWENERIASLLMRTERAMGEVVSAVIGQIAAEVVSPKPKEIRKEVVVKEVLPDWLKALKENQTFLFLVGLFFLAILCLVVFGTVWVAIALPIGWWLVFRSLPWTILVPIGLVLLIGVFV
jgi:hypothetical protein